MGRAKVFSTPKLWMESEALRQLELASSLPGCVGAFGMPDLHPGKGIPIGAAIATEGGFYPHLAGGDLGCGMRLTLLADPARKLKPEKARLEKFLAVEPDAELASAASALAASAEAAAGESFARAFGSIGGGNHFCEILAVSEVFDPEALEPLGIRKGSALILSHSGSRSMGEAVGRLWSAARGSSFADLSDPFGAEWLRLHADCLAWARLNREAVELRAARAFGLSLSAPLLDLAHNAIVPLPPEAAGSLGSEKPCFLHRKGASPAEGGMAILPTSRGDLSWLIRPAALPASEAGLSLAHGAGRKWARSECRGKLGSKAVASDLLKTPLGSRVLCDRKELLFEEAPQAYKSGRDALEALESSGLASRLASLTPLWTVKA